jgi:hypothetical protein
MGGIVLRLKWSYRALNYNPTIKEQCMNTNQPSTETTTVKQLTKQNTRGLDVINPQAAGLEVFRS